MPPGTPRLPRSPLTGTTLALAWILQATPAAAQVPPPPITASPGILEEIGIDQRLDAQVPLDSVFRDASGRDLALDTYFRGKPVVLSLVYYRCPMLCTMTLNGMLAAFKTLKFDIGEDFQVVTVSFDPRETPELAAEKKASYVRQYGRAGGAEGWAFLTGEETSIRRLARACGFRYRYDPDSDQYAHASGIMLLTPEGRLSRYFYGLEYSARDLQLGLVEASESRIGSLVDQVLLLCYQYDPTTGRYGFAIMSAIRIGGVLVLAALGGFIAVSVRRDKRSKAHRG